MKDLITLSIREIRALAECAGLVVKPAEGVDWKEEDTEITVGTCPVGGLEDEGAFLHYRLVAYFSDYPEEGCYGLGDEIEPVEPKLVSEAVTEQKLLDDVCLGHPLRELVAVNREMLGVLREINKGMQS